MDCCKLEYLHRYLLCKSCLCKPLQQPRINYISSSLSSILQMLPLSLPFLRILYSIFWSICQMKQLRSDLHLSSRFHIHHHYEHPLSQIPSRNFYHHKVLIFCLHLHLRLNLLLDCIEHDWWNFYEIYQISQICKEDHRILWFQTNLLPEPI